LITINKLLRQKEFIKWDLKKNELNTPRKYLFLFIKKFNMKRHIPNTITLLNLAAGFTGILFLLNNHIAYASYMIFLAAIFDFMDGFTARLLKAYSETGKSLDSLSDMVSFGVLPGLIVFSLIKSTIPSEPAIMRIMPYASFFIALCSAVRLAIFNNDETQKTSFKGLPTPANAIFFAGLALYFNQTETGFIPKSYLLLAILSLVFSYLLVSEIRMFSFKVKNMKFRENMLLFLFLLIVIILVSVLRYEGIVLSIIIYVFLSAGIHFAQRVRE
jgi:CDP-diacylglycerol---serine O-phosphatidyltransferase